MDHIPVWRRFEWGLSATGHYENPLADVRLKAAFTGPDGRSCEREGFWDGASQWKIRFRPDAPGNWKVTTQCRPADPGLDARVTEFVCVQETSTNPLYRHGPVNVLSGEAFLRHADGTPFFWLGDTAWNAILKAGLGDLTAYLEDRAAKSFNVVQFVATHWMAAAGNAEGRVAYFGRESIEIDPVFFRWMDRRIDLLNEHGFLGAAVIAWAAVWNKKALRLSPGTDLPDAEIVRLGRYLLARYGAHHMAWILAGDGHYQEAEAERWRRIGRAVFAGCDSLATIHPGGHLWLEDEFRGETWFRFHGYQSGHWRGEEAMRWLRNGPALANYSRTPPLPHINLEFCYEAHEDFETHLAFDALDIRRHAYASLLSSVPAGITYGAHGIWSWENEPGLPMSHQKTGIAPSWREAMRLPGSDSMQRLAQIFGSIEWWRLRPAPELLDSGEESSAAVAEERDLAIVYNPSARKPRIRREMLRPGLREEEIDAATGAAPDPGTADTVVLFQHG